MSDVLAERLLGPVEPDSVLHLVPHADPAADVELSYTVPGGELWRPLALSVELVCSIGGANRLPALRFTVFGALVAGIPAPAAVAAGGTERYSWVRGVGAGVTEANGADHAAPMPDVLLPAGSTITTATAGFFAGDNYGAPQLLVERVTERGPVAELQRAMVRLADRIEDIARAAPEWPA